MVALSFSSGLNIAIGAGVVSLIVALIARVSIGKQPTGNEVMQKIAGKIRRGAMAFLRQEYTVIVPFIVIAAILIYLFVDTGAANIGSAWAAPFTAVSFIVGALCSALAGFIGMRTATMANVRTAEAARTSVIKALRVSFSSGATMGFSVTGLGIIGFTATLMILLTKTDMATALEALTGFGFGASCVALFARVGGGIYTKAADVGADLVGKVEAGIPEDDPRNPAVIADNVGDNVGDTAGMGADLFESYVGSILATMLVGLTVTWGFEKAILFPLLVAAIGIVTSIIATFVVRTNNPAGVEGALKRGLLVASVLGILGTLWLAKSFLPVEVAMGVFWATVAGLVAGVAVGLLTEYFTSHAYKPVRRLAAASSTGPGTVLIEGLALGYMSTALPTLVIAAAMGIAFSQAGMYGVGIGAVGMLMTLAMTLAMDAFGPVADNAGGIAEMSKLPPEVRKATDALDAAGNTTAAIGKGFAIGVGGFMVLALFGAFKEVAQIEVVDVTKTTTLIGVLIGGMIPFLFSSLTMRAVGRAAMAIIEEVRRQFKEIPGLMQGTADGDPETCVAIATSAAIREMILPGLLAIGSPIVAGFILGKEGLGGLLAGALASSMMLGMSMSNSGGAWDNAKKYIETGALGGKGSPAHKAAVVGDTVGDPFKDTSGPSLNILVKLMSMVSVLTAGLYGAGLLG
ncbi:MAG: sodium-translocating pyrophosphatase [Candidatus Peribacteraceae bacterium]|nr:sodium-translocating pyrophosphatase [Candidatus Peribacteraceae bacterium]